MTPAKRFFYMFALTLMWSPSFVFIKLAIQELPPLTIVACRVGIAALLLNIILRLAGKSLPKEPIFWVHAAVMAVFSAALPFSLFCIAEQSIDSGLAAILNGTMPMFTCLMAHFFISSDRLSPSKVVGVGLSTVGLILLFSPNIQLGLVGTPLGMLAATGAAFSCSIGHVYAKRYVSGKRSPLVVTTAQLTASSAMLIPLAFVVDSPLSLPVPSLTAIGGVCALAFFGTTLAFIIYYKLLEHCGPTAVSMTACFFPLTGMLLGKLFLGESFTLAGVGAGLLIVSGIAVVNGVVGFKEKKPVASS